MFVVQISEIKNIQTSNFILLSQMNGIPVLQFYGSPKPHKCANNSISLVADNLHSLIFHALRFPSREKARKRLRVKIPTRDRQFYHGQTVEAILDHATADTKNWHIRYISKDGDANAVVQSSVKVQKVRAESHFARGSDGHFYEAKRHHGYEICVEIIRKRIVGARDAFQIK